MEAGKRILTIDIMRGITLFLMLFVNDLNAPGVPQWLTHTPATYDGMGLADWVFPGFLFMVGLAVPYAIQSRLKKGDTILKLVSHIIIRTGSLLIIGVLMVNISRLNEELTGMHKYLWAILIYLSVFLIWNQYRDLQEKYVKLLKGIGIAGLAVLMFVYKAGTPDEITWIRTSWWGILGLIGWGYCTTALTYILVKDSLLKTGMVWLFFVLLNVFSQLGMLDFLSFLNPIFGVLLGGNVPSIVLAGLFFSLILRKYGQLGVRKFVSIGLIVGVLVLVIGFVLRNWFILSKIMGTPSWAMVCNGISILLFVVLFLIIDVWGKHKWTLIFKPAGQNSLTTYLAPDIFYYMIWMFGLPVLFYKESGNPLIVVLGSVIWALLMIGYSIVLSKIGIRLKL